MSFFRLQFLLLFCLVNYFLLLFFLILQFRKNFPGQKVLILWPKITEMKSRKWRMKNKNNVENIEMNIIHIFISKCEMTIK